jgi:hypothetical protein
LAHCGNPAQRPRAVSRSACSAAQEGTMDRPAPHASAPRSVAGLEEARELRAAISRVLDETPVDEQRLRDAVWNYVGAEREAGVSPGRVMIAVTGLVEAARNIPTSARQLLLRSVIHWTVEANFGRLGGDVFGRGPDAVSEPPSPAMQ